MLIKLDQVLRHPAVSLLLGLFFIGTALGDLILEARDSAGYFGLRLEHGILTLGLLISIRAFIELFVLFQKRLDRPGLIKSGSLMAMIDGLMHNKILVIVVGLGLLSCGAADALEFVRTADAHGATHGLTLVFIGISVLVFVLFSGLESRDYLIENQLLKQYVDEHFLIKTAKFVIPIAVIGVGFYEEHMYFQELKSGNSHRSSLFWSLVVSAKNIIRAMLRLSRISI